MAPVVRHLYRPALWLCLAAVALLLSAVTVLWAVRGVAPYEAGQSAAWRDRLPASTPDGLTLPVIEALKMPAQLFVFSAPFAGRKPSGEFNLAEKYRLAGTFFVLTSSQETATRKAVLVNLLSGADYIVQESESFEGITVLSVERDYVVLQSGDTRETLGLGTGRRIDGVSDAVSPGITAADDADAPDYPDSGRFGERIGDNRWVFKRDKLLDYYQDVMRAPARLQNVFDSMRPLYDDNRRITGYELDVRGESDFFRDVGLEEGDVVRHVNSMAMSNRRRAEYLIAEFVHGRLNVFILDIERNGQPRKLIYEVR